MSIDKQRLRRTVRYFYDLQKLRMQHGNRGGSDTAELDEGEREFLAKTGDGLHDLEKTTLKEVRRLLRDVPIYRHWLRDQKGVGPTMAGVIVAEVDITRCETVSALWRYCGLAVDTRTGSAERRKRGEKIAYNPLLKTKLVHVLAGCMIKANSPWREHYDRQKHRRQNQLVPVCMACGGEGQTIRGTQEAEASQLHQDTHNVEASRVRGDTRYEIASQEGPGDQTDGASRSDRNTHLDVASHKPQDDRTAIARATLTEEPRKRERAERAKSPVKGQRAEVTKVPVSSKRKGSPCRNCGGTGGPAPWGKSDAHRANDANRIMIKAFLRDLWIEWRTLEGLPTPDTYAEVYLGRGHGTHGGQVEVHP